MPLVSIVVPTHNRPKLLREALASIQAQTFSDYEIIVISNGETSEMQARSKAVAEAFNCRFLCVPHGNVSAARNIAVENSAGDWIAFLDDDDLWLPQKLSRQVQAAQDSAADMVVCKCSEFWPDGRVVPFRREIPAGWSFTKALNHTQWCAPPSCVLVRAAVFKAVGGFDSRLRAHEDNDLWRRISWRHTIIEMDDDLARYRKGHNTITANGRYLRLYQFVHDVKIRLDTPSDLRRDLPGWGRLAWAVFAIATPKLLHQPFHPDRMQRRLRFISDRLFRAS